jgi:hypothetical protein
MNNIIENFNLSVVCLEKGPAQQKLYISSLVYISLGTIFSVMILTLNISLIAFLFSNKKAKYSPVCICIQFLATLNLIKLTEFYLSVFVKLEIIHHIKTMSALCKWLNFLPNYSGHVSVYVVLLIQMHQLFAKLLIDHRPVTHSKLIYFINLVVNNYALTYSICFAFVFLFFIMDQFYLYDNYYTDLIFCPLTLVYTCIVNKDFKLLKSFKFDTLIYHHFHTLIFNLIPLFLLCSINFLLIKEILKVRYLSRASNSNDNSHNNNNYNRTTVVAFTISGEDDNSSSAQISIHQRDKLSDSKNLDRETESLTQSSRDNNYNQSRITYKIELRQEDEIYLNLSQKSSMLSVFVSFLQIANTFPANMISYAAEWNNETLQILTTNRTLLTSNHIFNNQNLVSQVEIYKIYILYGAFDMLNFSLYLAFQLFNSKLLFKEFEAFLLGKIKICKRN